MSLRQSSAVPSTKKTLHPNTVLRVAIERPAGCHITQLAIITANGQHHFRLLPRTVRQLASRLNSFADKYDVQQKAGGAL